MKRKKPLKRFVHLISNMATLYMVATPIGNLEDITLRALRILRDVHTIICEDTRVTKKLLQHFDIHTPVRSLHAHSGEGAYQHVLTLLAEGADVAYVTDAGTPGISDPGALLVARVYEQLPNVRVDAIPGPSAVISALSIAGVPVHHFTFIGFLPHKKGREAAIDLLCTASHTMVCYESTHRIMKLLTSIATRFPSQHIILCREITKQFEERLSGTAEELHTTLTTTPVKQKGEFVVIIPHI